MSYGHTYNLFQKYGGGHLTQDYKYKNFVKDKYLNVFYYEKLRIKNNDKWSKQNRNAPNEKLDLVFDQNLSPDYNHSDLNLLTGESINLSLVSSRQALIGDTQLSITIQYTNANQELHETLVRWNCPTVNGTISKRLKLYKVAFEEAVKFHVDDYNTNGIKFQSHEKIKSLAAFILKKEREGVEHHRQSQISSNINTVLVLYSILSQDCLSKSLTIKGGFELAFTPYYNSNNYEDLVFTNLECNDRYLLESIYDFYKSNSKLMEGIFQQAEVPYWCGKKYDYAKLSELVRAKLSVV